MARLGFADAARLSPRLGTITGALHHLARPGRQAAGGDVVGRAGEQGVTAWGSLEISCDRLGSVAIAWNRLGLAGIGRDRLGSVGSVPSQSGSCPWGQKTLEIGD